MLDQNPHTAVHHNAAIFENCFLNCWIALLFEFVRAFDYIMLP